MHRIKLTRLIPLAVVYILIAVLFVGRLIYLQTEGREFYNLSDPTTYKTRTVTIEARRGEIYDRNGKLLVKNVLSYSVEMDYATLPATQREINDIIVSVSTIAAASGESDKLVSPRASLIGTADGNRVTFEYAEGFLDTARGRRYKKLLEELHVDSGEIAEEARILMLRYGIVSLDEDGESVYYNYTYEAAAKLLTIRLDMELSGFSKIQPYTVAKNVSLAFITAVEERYSRGLNVSSSETREYMYPGYASHILGLVSKIPSGQEDYYTERGYSLDATVGISGAEAAFEEYLRGTDGKMTITEDEDGSFISSEMTVEPVPGKDVYLTIDIDLQIVAEDALEANIEYIRATANPDKPLSGEDASAGAITVVDPHTGEILAMGSYPTYSLATYYEDFSRLNTDETSPLLNRALRPYAPGSTFKVGVAVAALAEGIIEADTVIDAQGQYMYYESAGYTPRCWLYLLNGDVHGKINVVEAIQESCNYFFYDVGRRLTIEVMNRYCRAFGLGEATGIELSELKGILAGPDYRNDNGLERWSPGDTLQAAIGQSDNLFTPLQLSNYISALLNEGTRYSSHLLSRVDSYPSGQTVFAKYPTVAGQTDISSEIIATVKEGMRGVMDDGSAAYVFRDYPIAVGGKTGTAQVYKTKSDNSIMTAFAPFDDPDIVVTCIIEQGGGGSSAGYAIRDIFDYYFELEDTNEQDK